MIALELIDTEVKFQQLRKASFPILATLLPIATEVKLPQPQKALLSILVTPSPIVTDVKNKKGLCGVTIDVCHKPCVHCHEHDCRIICDRYESMACHKPDSPPYVCNTCKERRLCIKDKYIYSAMHADMAVKRRRSDSRKGIRLKAEEKEFVDELVTRLVRKGQPRSA